MKDHSNFFLKEWTASPKKGAGTSAATFRQYSTFYDQKYVSTEDSDSRKKRDI